MSKSLKARCIRRWEVRVRNWCDSKWSFYWRKRHKKYFRETALTTADCMIERVADEMAWKDWAGADGRGWTPEFSNWYDERWEQYQEAACAQLNKEATTNQIDEEIEDELDAWND